ncbi:hypothetical protein [Lacinutrix himadriensis]|uniref:hypothetical protein n=1 Tax=Lacinutrix himadriensis TaxID=641549 RepID=UPI0006E43DB6|nr:hypothetical protein [Lacinutrix himadriensis]
MTIEYDKPLRYLKPLKPEHFSDLENINWFSNCGKEIEFSSKQNLKRIDSLKESIELCNSIEWENFQLEKRNDLTSFLNRTRKNESTEWNTITGGIKNYLKDGIFKTVREKLNQRDLPDSIFASVEWDILSYCQELAYKKYNIPTFYSHLIPIYKNGHLPCSYNGQFPNGTILIY